MDEASASDQPMGGIELDCAIEAARRAWPTIEIPSDAFAAYVRARMDQELDATTGLADLRTADLYLACGCAHGLAAARAAFEAAHFADLSALLGTLNPSASFAAQVIEQLKAVLYGPAAGARIEEYRGRGSLAGWIKIVALRLAHLRYAGFSQPDQIDQLVVAAVAADPALMRVRIHCGADQFARLLKQAVVQATGKLSSQDRNLLRWHLVENVSLRKIAFVRRQSLATVSDAYARISGQMQNDLRDILCGQTGLAPEDVAPAARRLAASPAAISMMTLQLPVSPAS